MLMQAVMFCAGIDQTSPCIDHNPDGDKAWFLVRSTIRLIISQSPFSNIALFLMLSPWSTIEQSLVVLLHGAGDESKQQRQTSGGADKSQDRGRETVRDASDKASGMVEHLHHKVQLFPGPNCSTQVLAICPLWLPSLTD